MTANADTNTISWEAPAYDGGEDLLNYFVQWGGQNGEFDEENSDDTNALTFSYQVSGALLPGTTVRVTPFNRNGLGAPGEFTLPATAPLTPDAPSLTTGSRNLTVTWTAPAGDGGRPITRYDLQYIKSDETDKSDDKWNGLLDAWTSGALTYTITGLDNGVSYDVQVRAENENRHGRMVRHQRGHPPSRMTAP